MAELEFEYDEIGERDPLPLTEAVCQMSDAACYFNKIQRKIREGFRCVSIGEPPEKEVRIGLEN